MVEEASGNVGIKKDAVVYKFGEHRKGGTAEDSADGCIPVKS